MNLYLDNYNGLWSRSTDANATHPWTLIARGTHPIHTDYPLGLSQKDEAVKFLGSLKALTAGDDYTFPVALKAGDSVIVDADELPFFAEQLPTYNDDLGGAVGTYVRESDGTNEMDGVVVNVQIVFRSKDVWKYGRRPPGSESAY